MARPPTTQTRVKELHEALCQRYPDAHVWQRPDWNALLCKTFTIGINQAYNLTLTGEALGLWKRYNNQPQPGKIELVNRVPEVLGPVSVDQTLGEEAVLLPV